MLETETVRALFLGALFASLAPRGAEASPQSDELLVTAQIPAGGALVALDPLTRRTRRLALWPRADLAGVVVAGSRAHVLDRGRGSDPARVRIVDLADGTQRTLSSGGYLSDPRHAAVLPDGALLVVDAEAVGGRGALVHVSPDGEQTLVSFGGRFARPSDLIGDGRGSFLVLDAEPVVVDVATGEQRVPDIALGPFVQPLACEARPGLGAFVCDGGALLHVDLERALVTRIASVPACLRDLALDADGHVYGVWSMGGTGGVVVVGRNGATAELVRTRALGDVRGIALAPAIDFTGDVAAAEPEPPFRAPPLPPLPPVSIEVRAQTITLLHGPGPADDEVRPAGGYPLAAALRAAPPGSSPVLGVIGEIPGSLVEIGGGDSPDKTYVAHWGKVPMRFAVVGLTPDARLHAFSLRQGFANDRTGGGVADAWFQDLTIEARYSECVNAPKGESFGLVRFYGCRFVPDRNNLAAGQYGGYGYRWGIRSQARGRWDLRGCTFAPVEEHCVYIDSPQGDSYFVDLQHLGSTRTVIQVVNRSRDNPGPSGFGTLLFEDVRIRGLWGDGGSGITVAGHLGNLVFRDVSARELPSTPHSHGAIVVWADADPVQGLYLQRGPDGRLHSTGRVTVESTDLVLPHVDRPMISIAGASEVRIDGLYAEGDRNALSLDSPYGTAVVDGPAIVDGRRVVVHGERVENGPVSFGIPCPISRWPGFLTPGKIELGGRWLSDAEIDAAWCR